MMDLQKIDNQIKLMSVYEKEIVRNFPKGKKVKKKLAKKMGVTFGTYLELEKEVEGSAVKNSFSLKLEETYEGEMRVLINIHPKLNIAKNLSKEEMKKLEAKVKESKAHTAGVQLMGILERDLGLKANFEVK